MSDFKLNGDSGPGTGQNLAQPSPEGLSLTKIEFSSIGYDEFNKLKINDPLYTIKLNNKNVKVNSAQLKNDELRDRDTSKNSLTMLETDLVNSAQLEENELRDGKTDKLNLTQLKATPSSAQVRLVRKMENEVDVQTAPAINKKDLSSTGQLLSTLKTTNSAELNDINQREQYIKLGQIGGTEYMKDIIGLGQRSLVRLNGQTEIEVGLA